jgi:hypothetical protein
MNKQMLNAFYNQRNFYLITIFFYKMLQTFYIFYKIIFGK